MTDADLTRFGESLARIDDEVHWDEIARAVCAGDAEGFFSKERRDAILDAGLKHAADVGDSLESADPRKQGSSLYIGAATFELAPLLFESIVLKRRVCWITLPGPEATEFARALHAVDPDLPSPRTGLWNPRQVGPATHLWMASVLTDPDAFPALHDELYGRRGGPMAVGGGRPKAERQRARELVERCLDALAPEALLTTSADELQVWGPLIEERGGRLEVSAKGRTSGLVGDVLHQARVSLPKAPGRGRH